MILHHHKDLDAPSPYPGLVRMICMDQHLGSGAITQGMVTIDPGKQSRPHTHRVGTYFVDGVGLPAAERAR